MRMIQIREEKGEKKKKIFFLFLKMINVVVCGDEAVGKTCIILRFESNSFTENCQPTIAVDFKQIHTRNYHYRICDTSGKTKFEQVVSNQFKGVDVHAVVFVFSNEESLESIVTRWFKLSNWTARKQVTGFLVQTKSDILKEDDDKDIIQSFAKTHNLHLAKVSSKTGEGVFDLFSEIGNRVMARHNELLATGHLQGLFKKEQEVERETFMIEEEEEEEENGKESCCCFCCRKKSFVKI